MKNIKTFEEFVNEGRHSQFGSDEQEALAMARAKWSNAVLAQDTKGMEKYIKDVVKATDAYVKLIKSKKA
jgi:hypothetical protein